MNKVLKDPLAVKSKHDGAYPFEFNAPSYDNRTSGSISAGDDYGIGRKTPVGTMEARSLDQGPIPQKAHCFSPNEIFFGKDPEDRKG